MSVNSLAAKLNSAISAMNIDGIKIGHPELIEKVVKKADELFKDYAAIAPNKLEAYEVASKLMGGIKLTPWERDLVAAAVCLPIEERNGISLIECPEFHPLINGYIKEVDSGQFWQMTWYWLFTSYLTFDLNKARSSAAQVGFSTLRSFLKYSWPYIETTARSTISPQWVEVLRAQPQLLRENAAENYAYDYLKGNTELVDQVAKSLGIPPTSWFWQDLVLSAASKAVKLSDEEFRELIPRIIGIISYAPVYRDKVIAEVLTRLFTSKEKAVHHEFRDYVIQPSVWRNPKLKLSGIAPTWNQVSVPVWQMVMSWVNERNLKDFFDILAARTNSDHGRLAFWSKYMKQITWTRLVFGEQTIQQKNNNSEIRNLLLAEQGAYAELRNSDPELDAFIMQIGDYIFVEFSKTGNGAYCYRSNALPFKIDASRYAGSTSDLKKGFYSKENGLRQIIHRRDWAAHYTLELIKLGIYPDKNENKFQWNQEAPKASENNKSNALSSNAADVASTRNSIDGNLVREVLRQYPGAYFQDKREGQRGRIWVFDELNNPQLEKTLRGMGFTWSEARKGWYLGESS